MFIKNIFIVTVVSFFSFFSCANMFVIFNEDGGVQGFYEKAEVAEPSVLMPNFADAADFVLDQIEAFNEPGLTNTVWWVENLPEFAAMQTAIFEEAELHAVIDRFYLILPLDEAVFAGQHPHYFLFKFVDGAVQTFRLAANPPPVEPPVAAGEEA